MRRLSVLPLLALTAAHGASAPIEGYWKNPIGSAIIAIEPCGAALCGKVVWASKRGRQEVASHTHQVVGMTVLTALRPDRGHWSGSLYIPDDDIHVAAHLQPMARGQMKLTGCAFAGLICRTQIWTRTEPPLPASG
jgi:uncharacterized protein (DUF2147 family)